MEQHTTLSPDVRGRPDTYAFEDATYRKVALRFIPFLMLCYVVAYLDRVNIGIAKLNMLADLQFSEAAYGLGAGLFFIGIARHSVRRFRHQRRASPLPCGRQRARSSSTSMQTTRGAAHPETARIYFARYWTPIRPPARAVSHRSTTRPWLHKHSARVSAPRPGSRWAASKAASRAHRTRPTPM